MTRHTLNTPTVPTQAEIDVAISRGSRLRSKAVLNAFAAIFGGHSDTPRTHTLSPR